LTLIETIAGGKINSDHSIINETMLHGSWGMDSWVRSQPSY